MAEQDNAGEAIDATAPVPAAANTNFFDKFDGDPKVNPFDQFDKDPDAGDAGLLERFRLHTRHSYYTGTLKGAGELYALAGVYQLPDDEASAEQKAWRNEQRQKYDGIVADLARFDLMRPWGTTTEAAVSLGGELFGGVQSPEAAVGAGAKGATWIGRTIKAGLQQGAIMGALDPAIQALSIGAQTQPEFDKWRWAASIGTGALIGGGLHLATGELLPAMTVRRQVADIAAEDPHMRTPGEPVAEAPQSEAAAPIEVAPQPAPTEQAERIAATAVRDKETGQVFQAPGALHIDLADRAAKELGVSPDAVLEGGRLEDGFVTSSGRFVDRFEAHDIAQAAEQVTAPHVFAGMLHAKHIAQSSEAGIPNREASTGETGGAPTNSSGEAPPSTQPTPGFQDSTRPEPSGMFDEAALTEPGEKIAAAAIRIDGGKIYTGTTHGEAVYAAAKDLGVSLDDLINKHMKGRESSQSLFTTTTGRVVTRGEAGQIASREQQFTSQRSGGTKAESIRMAPSDALALAARRGGGELAMERQRPEAGVPQGEAAAGGTAVATVPETPSPQKETSIRSLQQQATDLADAIGFPLREGRVKRGALGVFKQNSGVVRVKEVPDFEVVAHEAGHAIEAKVGSELTDLTEQYRHELAPLVSNAQAYKPEQHVTEGFAEFIRRYIGNPAHAEQVAPGFTRAFREFMGRKAPEIMRAIDTASEGYRAYLSAPSGDVIQAVRRSRIDEPHGLIAKAVAATRADGFASTINNVLQRAYRDVLDDKAPITRAVRELGKAIKEQTGAPATLTAADNPDVLLRLAQRSQQAAELDLKQGVRPYRQTTPDGPSLASAVAKATDAPSPLGKWNVARTGDFADYLIARRAEYLWRKFEAGALPNPPVAFSRGDAAMRMAELERAYPTFREASDMVHAWSRQLLRKQFEGGLIRRDLYDRLRQEEFYVPFQRDMPDKPLAGGTGGAAPEKRGAADTVKRLRGSSRDIIDPIESLMMQAFLVNRTIQHNDVIRSFVALAKRAGAEGGRYVETLPAHEARQYTFDLSAAVERAARQHGMDAQTAEAFASAFNGIMGEDPVMGSFFRMEPAKPHGEPIVFYKEGGELRVARFMSEREGHAIYETLTALPSKMTDLFSELISTTSSLMRSGVTTDPTFILSNYIRDQFAAAILRPDYIPIASGIAGIHQELSQGEMAKLYAYGGGVSPGAAVATVERAIEADVHALAKQGYLVNRVTSFKGVLELASVTEAGTRNSVFGKVFRAGKSKGLSDYEAMIEAAYEATDFLDFSRHGSRLEAVRRYIPFMNAALQGLDKARRALVDPLVREQVFAGDKAALNNAVFGLTKALGLASVMGAGWAALNADNRAYSDAGTYLKSTHVIVPLGGSTVLLVPKPFELSIGFTAGEYAYQALRKDDPRAAGQFAEAAWQVLNPVHQIPLIDTFYGLTTGKNTFTGKDIVPGEYQRLAPSQQYNENTSSLAKFIGSTINVPPMKVDYAIGSMFGNWGRDLLALSSGADSDNPTQSWVDRVFLRRFLKDANRTSDVTTKFWDYMAQTTGRYNQDVATFDFMNKGFRDQEAAQFLSKLPSNERAFVTLKSAADEDGKPAFTADERRLHPLQRAYDAVTVLNGLQKELTRNSFADFENGARLKLTPDQRGALNENIRELKQLEMYNALVTTKEPGYAGRPQISTHDTMDKITAIAPTVADEIATRYATARIYKADAIAAAYPQLVATLLRDGSAADVGDLAFSAQADGYEFDGDRVKRPPKRRLEIAPAAR